MLNEVRVMGHLGADPEVRSTPNGVQNATFRLACTKVWNDASGQRQERTEWVTCVAWRQQSEIVQRFLRKGSRCLVIGELQTRTWEDKNGGGKRYATEVQADRVILVDRRDQGAPPDGDQPAARQPRPQANENPSQGSDPDDLPF